MFIWILVTIILILIIWTILIYNNIISLKNQVKSAWSQIDVQLKRRHDLIPNLVSAVKGYMQYEQDVIQKVVIARTVAMKATRMLEKAEKENILSQALHELFTVIENYPVLKSSTNVLELQEELVSTENKIAFSRQFYNDLVANYKTALESFPNNIVASFFAFNSIEYFKINEIEKTKPEYN